MGKREEPGKRFCSYSTAPAKLSGKFVT